MDENILIDNLVLTTDAYKQTHWLQYPPGTEHVYSYFESRGGVFPETMFFGLQYFLEKYLTGEVITQEKIEQADAIAREMFGQDYFNHAGWQRVVDGKFKYDLEPGKKVHVKLHGISKFVEFGDE